MGRLFKGSSILYEGKFLNLLNREGWEYVDRHHSEGAVVIVAVTPEKNILFVEQYRPPIGKAVIELPAGLVSDSPQKKGEAWEDAALRELEEETGYRAGQLEKMAGGPISPGMSTEVLAFYRASQLKKIGPGGGEAGESITVHEVPLEKVSIWLEDLEKAGKIIDPKVYAGLYFIRGEGDGGGG